MILLSNIQVAIGELHVAFRKLNEEFFDNELVEPAITIQSNGKRKATMGWCSNKEVWSDKEGLIKKYELNISAEYLDYDFMETMDTMLHEMVHLYNALNDIKDTSRNGTYHNKRFKLECERRGFYFPSNRADKKLGWAFPKLTDETKDRILKLGIKSEAFMIARRNIVNSENKDANDTVQDGEIEEEKRPSTFKWVCLKCNLIVRSTKDNVFIKCGKCDETLIKD